MPTKAELIEQADALGVEYRARWPKDEIQAAIEGVREPDPSPVPDRFQNISGTRFVVCGQVLPNGEMYAIDGNESKRDLKKLTRALEIGKVKKV